MVQFEVVPFFKIDPPLRPKIPSGIGGATGGKGDAGKIDFIPLY
jgi:hypothetical protein